MTVEEYRAHPALNFSLAKHLLDSPAHFKAAQDEDQETTEAMHVGTLAHAMVLEGKDLRDLYAIKPAGMSFASKEGKAWRDAQTLPILKEDDANSIPRMADAITKNPDAARILKACQHRETPLFATLQGVDCKCLLDLHGEHGDEIAVLDFKSAQSAMPRQFAAAIVDRHYDLQMEWYCQILAMVKGVETRPWWGWIACENKAPFFNVVYQPSDEMIASGQAKLDRVLTLYKECTASGKWPFAITGIQTIELPRWAANN
jgi:hypothetical protein